jgi:hypothetical protein
MSGVCAIGVWVWGFWKMLFWKGKYYFGHGAIGVWAGGHGARRNFRGSDPWVVYSSFLIGGGEEGKVV